MGRWRHDVLNVEGAYQHILCPTNAGTSWNQGEAPISVTMPATRKTPRWM
jgi:hypothetical protein